jgi:hypothetical protein
MVCAGTSIEAVDAFCKINWAAFIKHCIEYSGKKEFCGNADCPIIIQEGKFIAHQPLQYKVKDGNMDTGMAQEHRSWE